MRPLLTAASALALSVLLCSVSSARSQDCVVRGHRCVDSGQCCGGCCFSGVCFDTYRSCLQSLDVCRNHACIGEQNCVVFVPPECPGCEPQPICK